MNARNSVQWKPGGSELLFIHHDQLYQASADGTRVHGTFEVPYEAHIESRSYLRVYLSHADVSPDGTRVAYSVCWDSFTFWDSPPREPPDEESRAVDVPVGTVFFEVAVWDATTDEVDYLAVGSVPVWSPDGTRIAFLSDYNYADPPDDRRARVEADPGLFSMAADGSDIQRLAPADHGDVGLPPRWSPDGQLLAFVRGVGSAEQAVYTVGADGSNLTADLGRGQSSLLVAGRRAAGAGVARRRRSGVVHHRGGRLGPAAADDDRGLAEPGVE